jgi:hypothetical protein
MLAHASGFAAFIFLFRYSLHTLLSETLGLSGAAEVLFIYIWSLSAPCAVGLGLAAGHALDGAPVMKGKLPALFGFTVGVFGMVKLVAEAGRWPGTLFW